MCSAYRGPRVDGKISLGAFLYLPFSQCLRQTASSTRRYYTALLIHFCFINSFSEDASHFCGIIYQYINLFNLNISRDSQKKVFSSIKSEWLKEINY